MVLVRMLKIEMENVQNQKRWTPNNIKLLYM